jgi:hypothetical protein
MTYPAARRLRRRRVIIAVIAAAVIGALILAVSLARSDRQVAREYLDAAMEVATGEEDSAARFGTMIQNLDTLERPALVERLDLLVAEASRLSEQLIGVSPPGPGELARAHSFLTIAVGGWSDGLTGARQALLNLSEEPFDNAGMVALQRALDDLRLGDRAYEEFEAIIRVAADADTLAAPLPSVRFISPVDPAKFTAQAIARRVIGLQSFINLGIADINLEPGPVGERDGIPVIPVSEQLDASATLSNRGTEAVDTIAVELQLISFDGEIYQDQQGIENLEPGELTTVSFAGLPVAAGKRYEVTITILGEDEDPADDVVRYTFMRNDEE